MVDAAEVVPPTSLALIGAVFDPTAVGVPGMTPGAATMVSPAGRPLASKTGGEPVAMIR